MGIHRRLHRFFKFTTTSVTAPLDNNWTKKCVRYKLQKIDKSVNIVGEIIMNSVKTTRQVTHNTKRNFHQTVETPFIVGLGLHIHKTTRSKILIDILSDFNLSISHDKVVLKIIKTMLSNAVVKEIENNGGVYVPPNISQGTRLHFAIDNVDFRNAQYGKGEFHGTGHVVFQKSAGTEVRNLVIDRKQ